LAVASGAGVLAPAAHATMDYGRGVGEVPSYAFERQRLDDRLDVGVNVASGDVLVRADDLDIAGTGLAVNFTRYWNSLPGDPSVPLGEGWSHNLNKNHALLQTAEGFDYGNGSQARASFIRQADGSFKPPAGLAADLSEDTAAKQMVLTFREDGTKLPIRLIRMAAWCARSAIATATRSRWMRWGSTGRPRA
jgi:hypothetical protein